MTRQVWGSMGVGCGFRLFLLPQEGLLLTIPMLGTPVLGPQRS